MSTGPTDLDKLVCLLTQATEVLRAQLGVAQAASGERIDAITGSVEHALAEAARAHDRIDSYLSTLVEVEANANLALVQAELATAEAAKANQGVDELDGVVVDLGHSRDSLITRTEALKERMDASEEQMSAVFEVVLELLHRVAVLEGEEPEPEPEGPDSSIPWLGEDHTVHAQFWPGGEYWHHVNIAARVASTDRWVESVADEYRVGRAEVKIVLEGRFTKLVPGVKYSIIVAGQREAGGPWERFSQVEFIPKLTVTEPPPVPESDLRRIKVYEMMWGPGAGSSPHAQWAVGEADPILAFANGTNLAMVGWGPLGETDFRTRFRANVAAGRRPSISLGGEGYGTPDFSSPAKIDDQTMRLVNIAANRFDGKIYELDWDFEILEDMPMVAEMVAFMQSTTSAWKSQFDIDLQWTCAPGGSAQPVFYDNMHALMGAVPKGLKFFHQLYDYQVTPVPYNDVRWRVQQIGSVFGYHMVGIGVKRHGGFWDPGQTKSYIEQLRVDGHPPDAGAFLWEDGFAGTPGWIQECRDAGLV